MQSVDICGPLGSQCKRTLKGLATKDPSLDPEDTQSLKLIGAIKTLSPGTVVTASLFKSWSQKTKVFHTLKRMAWIQSKEAFPDLDREPGLADWLVPPEKVLGGVDTTKWWVLDYHTPSGKYLRGSALQEIGITDERASRPQPSGSRTPAVVDAAMGASADGQGLAAASECKRPREAEADAIAGGPPTAPKSKARRLLREHPSDELVTEEDGTEALLQACQEDCNAGRFYAPDFVSGSNAHFKVRMYLGHLKARKASHKPADGKTFSDDLKGHERMFFRYLAKWLVEGESFPVMPHFVKLFKEAAEIDKSLQPSVAEVFDEICKFDITTPYHRGSLDMAKFGLTPHQAKFLTRSPFFLGFEKARYAAVFRGVKENTTLASNERAVVVESLLQKLGDDGDTLGSEEGKKELLIAKTVVEADTVAKMKYILGLTLGEFQILKQWFPIRGSYMALTHMWSRHF